MGTLQTKLSLLQRYFKIRFFVLSVILVISTILIPLWIPYVPDFEPSQSIYLENETGHSNLLNYATEYTISQNYDATASYADQDLIVLINPQVRIPENIINQLHIANEQGVRILIIGKSNIKSLGVAFDFSLPPLPEQGDRIFDEINNGGDLQSSKIIGSCLILSAPLPVPDKFVQNYPEYFLVLIEYLYYNP